MHHQRRPDLLSRADAAAYIGISPTWLSQHPPEKGGPPRIQIGARVYYRKADLDWFIDEKCHQVTLQQAVPAAPTPTIPKDRPCTFTRKATRSIGGANSASALAPRKAPRFADQRAKEIEVELRSKLAASGLSSKTKPDEGPQHLKLVSDQP